MHLSEITRLVIEGAKKTGSYYATYPTKKEGHMNREEIDTLWHKALQQAIKDGEEFTRYHFARLVAAAEREKFVAFLRQMHDAYALASDPPRGNT